MKINQEEHLRREESKNAWGQHEFKKEKKPLYILIERKNMPKKSKSNYIAPRENLKVLRLTYSRKFGENFCWLIAHFFPNLQII